MNFGIQNVNLFDIGHEYGDGNLGSRGMALFFHSHKVRD